MTLPGISIIDSLLHHANADAPIDWTLLAITTLVNMLHHESADGPMFVTLLGMVTEVNLLQLEKTLSLSSVRFVDIDIAVSPLHE